MENFPKFFESDEYFINQKVNFFKFEAEYKVFDKEGNQIGAIKQKLSAGHKALRLLLSKSMLPFLLEIVDNKGNTLAIIKRNWTFFMSEVQVLSGNNQLIGKIKQKWSFMKPTFHIMNDEGKHVAQIKGDWKGWNFSITNSDGDQFGTVGKKWAGAMKEVFTFADNYNVSIDEDYNEDINKIIVVSTAITIDMVLKESR